MFPRICFLFAVLAVGVGAGTENPQAHEAEVIDRVWSAHPVSFALLVERGHQFVAYYDADRRLIVAGRKLDEKTWTRIHPDGVPVPARGRTSNVTGWDSHNYLRLALDRDGCLHVSGNMHVDPLVYYRTREPFDVGTLERVDRMTGERETHCTYPVFFKNADGELFFRYRDGSSGNGRDIYNIYEPATRTWRRQLDVALLDGEGKRNAYAIEPVLGPDGYFHLVWMWRDTPDCATNHTLSYARSRDFRQWENSRGEKLALPITLATGDVVDPAKIREGLINMTFNLGFDAEKNPIVVYHRYDAEGRSQAYAARPQPAATAWDVRQISDWDFTWKFSGGGSIPAEVLLGAPRVGPENTIIVDYSTRAVADGRLQLRASTLERITELPPLPSALPAALEKPRADSRMEVHTVSVIANDRRYLLRWETLPRNRDRPRDEVTPPTALTLHELPATEVSTASRVGS